MPSRAAAAADNEATRQAVIEAARATVQQGLNRGTSGNISRRVGEGFVITPSALGYEAMQPDDVVLVTRSGEARGRRRPSSEWRLHHDIYAARQDAGAVVHAHPPHATAIACVRREIPAFHYMVAAAGGDSIRCAGYALFGTQALSDLALAALADRRACLLANHGIIALGADLDAALRLAVEVEWLAHQYWAALQVGAPALLNAAEMADVRDAFRDYRPS